MKVLDIGDLVGGAAIAVHRGDRGLSAKWL
jgi:hypothetical protein